MRRIAIYCSVGVLAGSVTLAGAGAADEVKAAAAKLAGKDNYSWTQTIDTGGQWRGGPTEGKTNKEGFTHLVMNWGDNDMEVVLKGDTGAFKTPDGWRGLGEAGQGGDQRMGFLSRMLRGYPTPAARAEEMTRNFAEVTKEGDVYSAKLTEEGARQLMRFGRGDGGPTISNAKGSAKFWIQEGVLSKFEYSVQGTMSWDGNDRDIDRTYTIEIKEVGTTKLEIPAEAKEKLS